MDADELALGLPGLGLDVGLVTDRGQLEASLIDVEIGLHRQRASDVAVGPDSRPSDPPDTTIGLIRRRFSLEVFTAWLDAHISPPPLPPLLLRSRNGGISFERVGVPQAVLESVAARASGSERCALVLIDCAFGGPGGTLGFVLGRVQRAGLAGEAGQNAVDEDTDPEGGSQMVSFSTGVLGALSQAGKSGARKARGGWLQILDCRCTTKQ